LASAADRPSGCCNVLKIREVSRPGTGNLQACTHMSHMFRVKMHAVELAVVPACKTQGACCGCCRNCAALPASFQLQHPTCSSWPVGQPQPHRQCCAAARPHHPTWQQQQQQRKERTC
jgi:hypothetical protein